jgi:hypothetical protein
MPNRGDLDRQWQVPERIEAIESEQDRIEFEIDQTDAPRFRKWSGLP